MTDPARVDPLPYSSADVAAALGNRWEETLLAAYRWMVLARTLDVRMMALQRQGRIGFYGAATGHEAVNVAAGLTTTPDDWVFPGLREQLVALVRGASLVGYAHSIYANDLDTARGRQMPCHPTAREVHYVSMSSVIGTQISHAVGLAYALKRRSDPGVALAFFGDGATSSNDFHAGLNFAAVFQLPVVFVCANNQWAISVPVDHQTATTTLAAKAAAYGIPGQRVDGTDFVATYRALSEAVRVVRSGHSPVMLEFLAYRMTPHSTSDDPSRYQPSGWAERAKHLDPVRRLEHWMQSNGLLSESTEASIRAESDEEVRAAIRAAETAPPPPPDSLTEDIYGPGSSQRPPFTP